MRKRFESFFLPDEDFALDQEKVSEYSDTEDLKTPSDRMLEEIRNREIQRGQFGIRFIFLTTTLISFVCAVPHLIGCNVEQYWIDIALLAWMLMPGWTYLSYWSVKAYDFDPIFHMTSPLLAIAIPGILFYFVGDEFLWATAVWIPLLPVVIWLHQLFKKGDSTPKRNTVFRQF